MLVFATARSSKDMEHFEARMQLDPCQSGLRAVSQQ